MRYWCLVTSKDNWEVCKKNGVFGFDYRYFETLKRFVEIGDKAVIYSHGGTFVAEVEITSDVYFNKEHIGWEKKGGPFLFPYRVDIKIKNEGELNISFSIVDNDEEAKHEKPNPIDEIVFIADKGKTWNIYFQVSILSMPKEDFEYISSRL